MSSCCCHVFADSSLKIILFILRNDYSNVLKKDLPAAEDLAALPSSYTDPSEGFSPETHLTSTAQDPSVNRYKKLAGQGLKEWEKSGWIWEGDPRGWMQWYIRFYEGRRCQDDTRQVMRCESTGSRRFASEAKN